MSGETSESHRAAAMSLGEEWEKQWSRHESTRRRWGVFYTPPALADLLTDLALNQLDREPRIVLEPTCGAGVFLGAVERAIATRFAWKAQTMRAYVVGVERDPVAAWIADREHAAQIHQLDVLSDAARKHLSELSRDPGETRKSGYDLVIGNPPFGGAIRGDTGRTDEERERFKDAFPLAARGSYDRCAPFVERALQLLSEDGVLAMILPRQFLAAPTAAELRRVLASRGAPTIVELDGARLFDGADIHVCGVIIGGSEPAESATIAQVASDPDGALTVSSRSTPFDPRLSTWSPMLHAFGSICPAALDMPRLDSFVEIGASAVTSDAYEWKPAVGEAADGEADRLRLVITGAIEPFACLWGTRVSRYLGDDYLRPVVEERVLRERRVALANARKVLVAGLSRVLEAWPDVDAAAIGAVATLTVRPRAALLDDEENVERVLLRLAAVINSVWCRAQYKALHDSVALSGGNLAVNRTKLGELQIPASWGRLLLGSTSKPVGKNDADSTLSAKRASERADWIASLLRTGETNNGFGLSKALPSPGAFQTLLSSAQKVAEEMPLLERVVCLDWLLAEDPQTALNSGVLDVLLLSVADDELALIAALWSQRSYWKSVSDGPHHFVST